MGRNQLADHSILQRFEEAQEGLYDQVLCELAAGKKLTHWMWFIFPQVAGLGSSATSIYYAIGSTAEAETYLAHPILGRRLHECTEHTMDLQDVSMRELFGPIDEQKFHSSMTLFALCAGPRSIYQRALFKYFNGQHDQLTLDICARPGPFQ